MFNQLNKKTMKQKLLSTMCALFCTICAWSANGFEENGILYQIETKYNSVTHQTEPTGGVIVISSYYDYNNGTSTKKEYTGNITIPATVTHEGTAYLVKGIDSYYCDLSKVSNINVSPDNSYIKSIDGVVYSKDGDTLICCPNRTEFSIPEGVKVIGNFSFGYCNDLTTLIMPASLEYVDSLYIKYDHEGTKNLKYITIKSTTPPEVGYEDAIYNRNGYLYVPKESYSLYDEHWYWGGIKHIQCIEDGATAAPGGVTIETGTGSAVFTWPKSDNAVAYELKVLKDGVEVCSLEFNAQGQVTGIVLRSAGESEGFKFKVGGLEADSEYDFRLKAIGVNDTEIASYTGTFRTDGGMNVAVEEANTSDAVETARYDINGRTLNAPAKGVNIVKYSDGSVEKEFVQ